MRRRSEAAWRGDAAALDADESQVGTAVSLFYDPRRAEGGTRVRSISESRHRAALFAEVGDLSGVLGVVESVMIDCGDDNQLGQG